MSARFDAEELRSYAGRDWGAPERLARAHRVKQPIEQKVRLAIALYEAARNTNPGWPSEAVRRAGKTFLCQSLPDSEYLDCELPSTRYPDGANYVVTDDTERS